MKGRIFTISIIVSLLLCSSLTLNGALATNSQAEKDTQQDEINGPGGLMSLSGTTIQDIAPSDPLQIKEHHPAHVKKFIGSFASSSTVYAPVTVWSAYGFNKLSCAHTATAWTDSSLCGHGQTIAIVDAYDDPNIESDLGTFDTQFGLPSCTVANKCFVKSTPQGTPSTDSGWALEIALDVEWAHSIAPGATIVLVESHDNSLGNLLVAEDAAVGAGAQQVSNSWGGSEFSTESSYDSHFNSPTASFFASSGDSGHGVYWPAASPYVISVGGTTLSTDSSGNYLSETTWSGSGGGISAYVLKPSYQSNFNPNSNRAVPDVAYNADPNTGVYVYDSVPINGQSGWWQVGGTSAGSPQWAGISAIANSQNAKLASASFGTSNALYGTASGAQSSPQTNPYLTNFHDITTGSNGNCGSLCNAIIGYDEETGLGSPQVNNLVSSFSPPSSPDFTISTSPSSLTVNSGSGSSTITITSVNGFTGTVSLSSLPSSSSTINPTSVTVPASGSATATLSLTPTASTTYTITGTSGSLTHSTTMIVTVPTISSAPQNLVATAGNTQVTLKWNAPSSNGGSAITAYNVYRGTTPGGEGTTAIGSVSGSTTSYTDTGLTNGNKYYYTVNAVNAIGTSSSSNEASATPQTTPTLTVSLTTDKSTYSHRSTAHITVTVTNSTPVSGASVTLTVTNPNGSASHNTGTTNSNGQVTFSYNIGRFAATGTYTASATATKSGYNSGSGSITFIVNAALTHNG